MCVIIVKQRGSDFCPLDKVKLCFDANPHGFAFAWNQGGELHVFKTLDKGEALSKYSELCGSLNPAESAMVIHARLRTHGSISLANCHCFTHGDIAFAHNGVLDIESKNDMTDSEIFFRELFVPAMDALGMDFALKMARMFIGSTNNKFALIDKDGHLWFTSGSQSFIKKKFDGYHGVIYFSNTRWEPVSSFSSLLGGDPYESIRTDPVRHVAKAKGNCAALGGKTASGRTASPAFLPSARVQAAPPRPLAVHATLPFEVEDMETELERRYREITKN